MMGDRLVSGWVPVMPQGNLIGSVLNPAISGLLHASAGSVQHSGRPQAVLGQESGCLQSESRLHRDLLLH